MRLPLVTPVLPRLLAPVLPITYSPKTLPLTKAYTLCKHWGFPYHTFVHCRSFAPAAPRRAGTSISVFLSGLPLSRPILITGLVSHYLTNSLISRHPIQELKFGKKIIPDIFSYLVLTLVSRRYPKLLGMLMTCY